MVGQNIAGFREAKDWTQYDLAAASSLAVDTIRSYEQGRAMPRVEQLEVLAKALDIRPFQLLLDKHDKLQITGRDVAEYFRNVCMDHDSYENLVVALSALRKKR